jgi:hypothetical protein
MNKLNKSIENPLKKSCINLKNEVKKLVKVAPNNQLDFYALDNYNLSGPFSTDDISYEISRYNDEAALLEQGVDLLYLREYIKAADFMKEFKVDVMLSLSFLIISLDFGQHY